MIFFSFIVYHLNASNISKLDLEAGRGHDRKVVGFTTTNAISVYHH
jgi:hypothetical protein